MGQDCPVLYHTGPCGNQSPRHVTRANTFDEAARLGHMLGRSIAEAIRSMSFIRRHYACRCRVLRRSAHDGLSDVAEAREQLDVGPSGWRRFAAANGRSPRDSHGGVRLVRRRRDARVGQGGRGGAVEAAVAAVMPAEIMLMRIGPWSFVGWPGEAFVEFALKVKARHPNCHVISMANGELQGYLVTEEAMQKNWYEAMNSLFASPEAGMMLVNETLELLRTQGLRRTDQFSPLNGRSRHHWSDRGEDSGDRSGNDLLQVHAVRSRRTLCCDTCRIPPPSAAARPGRMELPADAF